MTPQIADGIGRPVALVALVIAVTLSCLAGAATAAVCPFNAHSFGARGDGVTDDTDSLQAAINAAAVDTVCNTVYVPDGTYMIAADTKGLVMASNVSLDLAPGAILKAKTCGSAYSVVRIFHRRNVTIRGGIIMGDRPAHAGSALDVCAGIDIRGSEHVRVENVHARLNWQKGFWVTYFDSTGVHLPCKDVTFERCEADSNREAGFSVFGCVGGSLESCTSSVGQSYGFRLAVNAGSADTVAAVVLHACRANRDSIGFALTGPEASFGAAPGMELPDTLGAKQSGEVQGTAGADGSTYLRIANAAGTMSGNVVNACVADSADWYALQLNLRATSNVLHGCVLRNSGRSGLHMFSYCRHNLASGNVLSGNARLDTTFSQVYVYSNCDSNSMQANTCRAAPARPRYAALILDASCIGNLVFGNDLLTGGIVGALSDGGTGTRITQGNRTAPMSFNAGPVVPGKGSELTWETKPGLEGLAGYRIDKAGPAAWESVSGVVRTTLFLDTAARPGDRYRLVALPLDSALEDVVAEAIAPPMKSLTLTPQPGRIAIHYMALSPLTGGDDRVRVTIHDVRGRCVRQWPAVAQTPGYARLTWDGRDTAGAPAPAGIYFVTVQHADTAPDVARCPWWPAR